MPKYKEYFQKMIKHNTEMFDEFRKIHDEYGLNPDKMQEKYNEVGRKIQYVIRKYEDMLCGRSEGSGYGKYTANLAEKFWGEIRANFAYVDAIGVTAVKESREMEEEFVLKRIEL